MHVPSPMQGRDPATPHSLHQSATSVEYPASGKVEDLTPRAIYVSEHLAMDKPHLRNWPFLHGNAILVYHTGHLDQQRKTEIKKSLEQLLTAISTTTKYYRIP